MKFKKILLFALLICLLLTVCAPAACAAEAPGLGDFIDRCGPLLGDGLDALTDWLNDKTSELGPELLEALRGMDAEELLSDLRELAAGSAELDDDALRTRIEAVAEQHGIRLVDSQVRQLMELCRALEKLSPEQLKERTEALERLLETPGGLRGAWSAVVRAVSGAAGWIARQFSELLG